MALEDLLDRDDLPEEVAEVIREEITAHRQAVQELRRLSLITEQVSDAFITTDLSFEITYANRAFEGLYGYSQEEVLGQSPDILNAEPTSQDIQQEIYQTVTSGEVWSRELENRRKDGTTFLCELSIFPLRDERGKIFAYAGLQRDITGRKRHEEQLRESEKLAAMGSLVGSVAHEVRNPLFALSATLDAFENRYGKRQEFARYLKTLRDQANRVAELMARLLDYGRSVAPDFHDTLLTPVVEQAVEACRPLAQERAVGIRLRLPGTLPLVALEEGRLRQVFENVIMNAIQHSPRDGTVSVTVAETEDEGGSQVESVVRDSGPGFQHEDLPHLFEPFFSMRKGGTGLGLAIVWRIVHEHHGTVITSNDPEGGAVVAIKLPASKGS